MASQTQVLQLYRDILKAAKRFPSIKRNQILADIKTEFHANKVHYQLSILGCITVCSELPNSCVPIVHLHSANDHDLLAGSVQAVCNGR